jgi:hypothetical protein
MDLPAPGGPVRNHHQMLALLRASTYVELRQWAAENMYHFDWHISPEIVDGLLSSAREDSVPAVRTACIRSLLRMNVNTVPVVTTLHSLKSDRDPTVRAEAEKALSRFSAYKISFRSQPYSQSVAIASGR